MKAVEPLQSPHPHIPSHDLTSQIRQARSIQELAELRRGSFDLPVLAASFSFSGFSEQLNAWHDLFIRRCIELCIEKMAVSCWGNPPVPYAFLLFGSGGRREQTMFSDQDNGLVYQLPEDANDELRQQIGAYFKHLGQLVVNCLSEVGYPPCVGNVLCANERWNRSLDSWQEMFSEWCRIPSWENIRYLLLTADARMITGDSTLFTEWHARYQRMFTEHPALVGRCVSNTLHHRVPLGLFGQIHTEVNGKYRGAIHVKNGLYLPYVNCIRLWSLRHGIRTTSSVDRIEALQRHGAWSETLCKDVSRHFGLAIYLRLLGATHWEENLFESSSYLKMSLLTKEDVVALKQSMKLALHLHKMTASLQRSYVDESLESF